MKIINDQLLQDRIRFRPHPAQIKILNGMNRFTIIPAGRRFGKSQFCAYIALRELMATGRNIWIVSPTYDLSKKVFNYIVKWVGREFSHSFKIQHAPTGAIESPTGSRLETKSAETLHSLMGEELDLVIIDEASAMSKEVWETYLYPSLANRQGRALFISTPKQKNWFYHLYIKGRSDRIDDKDYSSFHFQSKDNPYFSSREWENARKTLPIAVFDQEYRATFISDAAAVFRNIRSCIKGELKDPEKDHLYVVGIDLAKFRDFTAIVVVDQIDNQVVFVDKFQKIDWTLQKKRIIAVAQKYNDAYINIDATGKGDPIVDDLMAAGLSVNDFKYTNQSKTQLFSKLAIFIEQNKISYPFIQSLIDELEAFSYTKTPGGRFTYSAPEGQHDDQVNALALAVWELDDPLGEGQGKAFGYPETDY